MAGSRLRNDWIRVEASTARESSKAGAARVVPLTPEAKRRLLERGKVRRIDTDLVFLGREFWPQRRWALVKAASGLEDFTFHDLRHTAASILTQRRIGLQKLASWGIKE